MSLPDRASPDDRSLLRAAQSAMERGDLQCADSLFIEHLTHRRDDAIGLASYGDFCLRTGRAAVACYLLYKANELLPGDSELLNLQGYARLEQSDFEIAPRSFMAALSLSPEHGLANYGLGLCHERQGAWQDAIEAFAQALAVQPGTLPILVSLAQACHRAGDSVHARSHFECAERMAPDDPALLVAYARFLRELGDAGKAMRLIDRLTQRYPDAVPVILEKACCLRELHDPAHAMRWLDRLEKLSPGLPECAAEYGNCLLAPDDRARREMYWLRAVDQWIRKGEIALAGDLLDRLLSANPGSAAAWNSRGVFERARDRPDAAESAYRNAIRCDPYNLEASANLALLYEGSNRVQDAMAVAESALQFIRTGAPQNGAIELHLVLSKVRRRRQEHARGMAHLDRIEAFGPTELQTMLANFERGRILDQLGDSPGAMAAFTRANALALAPWHRENPGGNKTLAGLDHMLDVVDKGWLRRWKPIVDLPACPAKVAFLVGFPRSGTTLLNQIFDGHDLIQAMEEKPPVQAMMDIVRCMPGGYPHAITDFDALDIAYLREAYFRSAAEHGAPNRSKLILDKFPMQLTLAGLLHRVFPQAQFVFALRHPCDVVLSCFMQNFRLNNTMANFCTLAGTVAVYTRTMDLWSAYLEQMPLAVHTVRYEDVVEDFDDRIRSVCEFLDVGWDDSLRQFATRALDRGRINTPSYDQVSRPIYGESRYRWERYRDHLLPYLPTLTPYIKRFGYADPEQAS